MVTGQSGQGRALNASAKLLRVLEAVSDEPGSHRLTSIVSRTGLAKTSVYRLLGELADNGYLVRGTDGCYRPSTGLQVLAAKVHRTEDARTTGTILAALQRQVGATVHYALRSEDWMVYLDKVEGAEQHIRMASQPGRRVQLHSSGLGKAVLAALPDDEIIGYAERTGLTPATVHTITDLDALLADCALIRSRGYAVDDEENELQVRCLAAPVLTADHEPVGAVSVSTVAALVPRDTLTGYGGPLRAAADQIGAVLEH